jgi:protein-disulfide isomerase
MVRLSSPLPLSSFAVLLVLAAAMSGANCKSKDAPAPLGGDAPKTVTAPAPAPADGLTEDEAKRLLPGVDTSTLSPKQRADLNELANDAFCPCEAKTVAGCLRAGTCPAAVRELDLARRFLAAGIPRDSALVRVETYYASFGAEKRKEIPSGGPREGSADAKVKIVEFSDFQCPACKAAHPGLEEVVKKYPNDVSWEFRHFPLPQHEHAAKAAQWAVYAAGKGRFWELASQFFAHQDQFTDEGVVALAKEAGLDAAAMLKAVAASDKYEAKVEADKQLGSDLQLSGTPAIYINGRQLVSLPPMAELLAVTIEDELEWQRHGGAWTDAK